MSIYKIYTPEQIEELQSNFLINSWSYSKVTGFARNEKAFEMQFIFGLYSRKSASSIAGNAYHEALRLFFEKLKEGKTLDLVELEQVAFDYIENVPANSWKLQKTTPTIEEAKTKANVSSSSLLKNFLSEVSLYTEDIMEVLEVETKGEEFVSVNGVDIPLPCRYVADLIILTKDGKRVVVDHKSKSSYTNEQEAALSIGVQAITYVLSYESKTGQTIDEVWFIENKASKNKDGSKQMQKFAITLDKDTRRLYEALLYEPLKRMIEAVSDPDHVYIMNQSDSFVDQAELYDFWARTMISEVEDFNVEESKKALIGQRLKKIRDASVASISPQIIKKFKENASAFINYDLSNKDMTTEQKIEHTLRSFGVQVQVAHKFEGYSSCTFLIEVSAGTKINNINQYRLNIASALDVANVRIGNELMVFENKSYLPVEYSKRTNNVLGWDKKYLIEKKIPVGIDNFDKLVYWDLENHATPHIMVCGSTGSGKSVFLRSTIEYAIESGVEKVFILDPKFEFLSYKSKANVYNDILDIEKTMEELVLHMNKLVKEGTKELILVVLDEFADAVANSRKGNELKEYENVQTGSYADGRAKYTKQHVGDIKSLEENLRLLAQKGRSVGIRIVAATQRASSKIITGDAKVNFPVQICFRVAKEIDSRVVLDEAGAESLAGYGDGLIKSPEYLGTKRFQAFYKQ
jgi:S-DNA-T family DNA segregation ATPase FtsK/SpoIIIE